MGWKAYCDPTIDQAFLLFILRRHLIVFYVEWRCGDLSQQFGIQGNNNEEMGKMSITWISEGGFLTGISVHRIEIYAWGTSQHRDTGKLGTSLCSFRAWGPKGLYLPCAVVFLISVT